MECGHIGDTSDAAVFATTALKEAIDDGSINFPTAKPLPGADGKEPIPYFLVGDEAFSLKTWTMKPLPTQNMSHKQRVYNYIISRARRVVENAFGLITS